jgi:hypothetical protein
MGFKEFVIKNSDSVISKIRKIRDQMRVIRTRIHLIAFPLLRISKAWSLVIISIYRSLIEYRSFSSVGYLVQKIRFN